MLSHNDKNSKHPKFLKTYKKSRPKMFKTDCIFCYILKILPKNKLVNGYTVRLNIS